jgi:signal transduction histidine kinase
MKEISSTSNANLIEFLVFLDAIKKLLNESDSHNYKFVEFEAGDVIIEEEEENDSLYVIFEGFVELLKVYDYDREIKIDRLEPGNLVGVLTFWTGEPAFTLVKAKTYVKALRLTKEQFKELNVTHPELNNLIQPLVVRNLVERYRRIVYLNLKMNVLKQEIEQEKNSLREAYQKLELTTNRMIHQEKMATLGQLVAGVAHEINNPTAALIRSIDNMKELTVSIFQDNLKDADTKAKLFEAGLQSSYLSSEEQRTRMGQLEQKYPYINRSIIRVLAQINDNALDSLTKLLKSAKSESKLIEVENLLKFFEIGTSLKSLKISSERIEKMVRSLRNYSKQSHGAFEVTDIRQSIEDTLLMLGNKLRNIDFLFNIDEIPKVKCCSSEMNQVWTNLIVNAIDAMNGKGIIVLEGGYDSQYVWIRITDSGSGIPEKFLNKIFQPNFTTKTASGSFGLGLGLAITNDIVNKHDGKIDVSNSEKGGASFTVYLPINNN